MIDLKKHPNSIQIKEYLGDVDPIRVKSLIEKLEGDHSRGNLITQLSGQAFPLDKIKNLNQLFTVAE